MCSCPVNAIQITTTLSDKSTSFSDKLKKHLSSRHNCLKKIFVSNYVNLSDQYVNFSDHFVDLSENYVHFSDIKLTRRWKLGMVAYFYGNV